MSGLKLTKIFNEEYCETSNDMSASSDQVFFEVSYLHLGFFHGIYMLIY